MLDALWTRGHIEKYACDGREYGFIPSWLKHQVINNRESVSVLPIPTEESILARPATCESRVVDASITRLVQVQGEGKGKERNTDASITREESKLFDEFWKAYPRKVAKPNAEKAWKKIKPDLDLAKQILRAIEVQKDSDSWKKDSGAFIPHPATWLNSERWNDESGNSSTSKDWFMQ